MGHLVALRVTPATEQDRAQVGELAEAVVQEAAGESVELAYVDRGYTGEEVAEVARAHGIRPWSTTWEPRRASCCCHGGG